MRARGGAPQSSAACRGSGCHRSSAPPRAGVGTRPRRRAVGQHAFDRPHAPPEDRVCRTDVNAAVAAGQPAPRCDHDRPQGASAPIQRAPRPRQPRRRAEQQETSGVRVPAKIVPAVTDVAERHAAQRRSPSLICHQPPSTAPQKRQLKPSPPTQPLQEAQASQRRRGTTPAAHASRAGTPRPPGDAH